MMRAVKTSGQYPSSARQKPSAAASFLKNCQPTSLPHCGQYAYDHVYPSYHVCSWYLKELNTSLKFAHVEPVASDVHDAIHHRQQLKDAACRFKPHGMMKITEIDKP